MKQISDEEYDHYQRLRKVFGHLYPEMSGYPFLTGVTNVDEYGFPEYVHICRAFGLTDITLYKKV